MLNWILAFITILISICSPKSQSMGLYFSNHQVLAGERVCVQLKAVKFQNMTTLQFTIQWRSEELTYIQSESVLSDVATNSTSATTGALQVSWLDFTGQGVSLPDSSRLFEFCFIASRPIENIKANIEITDEPTAIEISQLTGDSIRILPLTYEEACIEIVVCKPIDLTYLTAFSCNPLDTGIFEQILTRTNGCDSIIRTRILLEKDASINFTIKTEPQDCSSSLSILTVTPQSDELTPLVYSIDGGSFSTDSVFSKVEKGDHQITIQTPSGCEKHEWVNVTPIPELQIMLDKQKRILFGDSIELKAFTNRDEHIVVVDWNPVEGLSCTDCLNPTVKPPESTIYTLTVGDRFGCKKTVDISIIVNQKPTIYAYAPTAFSPNQDGMNDFFTVYFKPKTVKEISSFKIFDQWGNLVHAMNRRFADANSLTWDGKVKNQHAFEGVYVWFLDVVWKNGEKDTLRGDVVLIR